MQNDDWEPGDDLLHPAADLLHPQGPSPATVASLLTPKERDALLSLSTTHFRKPLARISRQALGRLYDRRLALIDGPDWSVSDFGLEVRKVLEANGA